MACADFLKGRGKKKGTLTRFGAQEGSLSCFNQPMGQFSVFCETRGYFGMLFWLPRGHFSARFGSQEGTLAQLPPLCTSLGLVSATLCAQKNKVSWLPEHTEWPGFSINGCFSSLMARDIENLWDMLEKTLHRSLTLLSSIQDLGERLLCMKVNVVMLHKLIKTMPRPMCAVIKS